MPLIFDFILTKQLMNVYRCGNDELASVQFLKDGVRLSACEQVRLVNLKRWVYF
jgi:hypothetical protein